MKRIFSILMLLGVLLSQDFTFYANFGTAIHILGSEEDSKYEDTQEDLKQSPALADFYQSGFMSEYGIHVGLFDRSDNERRNGHFLVGFSYFFDTLESIDGENGLLLGEEISIETKVPLFGYAFYRKGKYKRGHYYIVAGPSYSTYIGKHIFEKKSYITKYKENVGVYFGAGFVSRLSDNIALDFGASYLIRDTKPISNNDPDSFRDSNGNYIENGDTKLFEKAGILSDNTVKLKIGLMIIF